MRPKPPARREPPAGTRASRPGHPTLQREMKTPTAAARLDGAAGHVGGELSERIIPSGVDTGFDEKLLDARNLVVRKLVLAVAKAMGEDVQFEDQMAVATMREPRLPWPRTSS